MPKGPVQTPITDQEIAFAHLVLAGTMTDQEAAKAIGIDPSRAAYVKNKSKVQAYMEEHRASVRAGLVQHEVEALAKFNISREQILGKWWEFANLDPALGYSTSSQSKALELLWKGLGYAETEAQKPKEAEPELVHDVYRAVWMRKPGDPDYEEEEEKLTSAPPAPMRAPDPEPSVQPIKVEAQQPASHGQSLYAGNTEEPGFTWVQGGNFGRFQKFLD